MQNASILVGVIRFDFILNVSLNWRISSSSSRRHTYKWGHLQPGADRFRHVFSSHETDYRQPFKPSDDRTEPAEWQFVLSSRHPGRSRSTWNDRRSSTWQFHILGNRFDLRTSTAWGL